MKTSNFTTQELKEYYEKGKTQFLKYRRVFQLMHSNNNGFYFVELERYKKYGGLPYTRRGRFIAFTPKESLKIINA